MNLGIQLEYFADSLLGLPRRAALALASWPGARPLATEFPDLPDYLINYAVQLSQKELGNVNAFFSVPMVNACVKALQQDICSIPLKVYRGRGDKQVEIERTGKPVDQGGNLADLLCNANPLDTGRAILEGVVGSRVLSGTGYWYLEFFRGPKKPPGEIRNMPGHLVRPVPGPNRTIAGYEFQPGGAGPWKPIAAENVVRFPNYTPLDKLTGIADIEAVKEATEAQYFALLWLREFFRNGGVFPGVWSVEDGDVAGKRYSDDQLRDISKRLLARMTLRAQELGGQITTRFLPIVVQGLKYVTQGMKISEMEIDKQLSLIDKKIILACQIPPWRVGIQEGGTFSTGSQTDNATYWLGTVTGKATSIVDVINERISPLFGADIHVELDFAAVPAIQQIMLEQAKAHFELTGKKPVETQNEARRAMKLPEDASEEANSIAPTPAPALNFGGPASQDNPPASGKAAKPGKSSQRATEDAEEPGARRARLSRDELRSKAALSLAKFRGRMETLVLERLAEQRAVARERLKERWEGPAGPLWNQDGKATQLALDIQGLIDPASEEDNARARKILAALLEARGIEALKDLEAATGIAIDLTIDIQKMAWAEFLRTMVERAIAVPDETTRRMLRESLAEGLNAGEALDQMLARVDHVFEGRRNNALTIARTETQPAYNFAAIEAWKESGVVDRHEWLTSHSGTGGRHAENPDGRYDGLDGQIRALGEAFDVGGTPLLYPGDPAGPVGETANCACTTNPIVSPVVLRARRFSALVRPHANGNGNGRIPKNRIHDFVYGRGR